MSTRVGVAALLGASLCSGCIVTGTKSTVIAYSTTTSRWTTTFTTVTTTTTVTPPDRTPPTPPAGPTFDPVAVGFELDAALEADGTLTDYYLDDAAYAPAVILAFAGEGWFDGTDPDAICYVWGEYRPEAAPDLATGDGAPLRAAWSGALALQGQDCAGRVDPAAWGADAERLYGPYDGATVGIGLGAMTPYLLEGWSEEELASLGPSLLGEYVSIGGAPAEDWSSAGLFAWDEATGDLVADGAGSLVPVAVPAEGPLPSGYVRSWAWWYEDL